MLRKIHGLKDLEPFDRGRLNLAFAGAMQTAMLDLADRAGDDRDRSITIKLSFKPIADERGNFVEARMEGDVNVKLPNRRTASHSVGIDTEQGAIVFNDHAPENVRQGTLDQVQNQEGGE